MRLAEVIAAIGGVRRGDAGSEGEAREREIRRTPVVHGDVNAPASLGDPKQIAAEGEDATTVRLTLVLEGVWSAGAHGGVDRRVVTGEIDSSRDTADGRDVDRPVGADAGAWLEGPDDERDRANRAPARR